MNGADVQLTASLVGKFFHAEVAYPFVILKFNKYTYLRKTSIHKEELSHNKESCFGKTFK